MGKLELFEVPVYSKSKIKHEANYKKESGKLIDSFVRSGHSREDAENLTKSSSYGKAKWRFNSTVGYIVISISNSRQDIILNLYKKGLRVGSEASKKYIIPDVAINSHFRIAGKDNDFISEKIVEETSSMLDHFKKSNYIDVSVLENAVRYFDFEKLISEL